MLAISRRKLQIIQEAARRPGLTPDQRHRLLALVRSAKANVKLAIRALARK
jgi:hypothetical protein